MRRRIPVEKLLRPSRSLSQQKPGRSLLDPVRTLAQISPSSELFANVDKFAGSPVGGQEAQQRRDSAAPDERTLKLGKTLRTLQPRLPTLLASPLPPDILSPHISLHLFPSTHPHLPTVSGRVAYHAALWTSPITWGRVPLVGKIELDIVSERMVRGHPSLPHISSRLSDSSSGEKLIVRWRTCGRAAQWLRGYGFGRDDEGGSGGAKGGKEGGGGEEEFSGIFVFEFDAEGRVSNHIIERAEGSDNWDNGVGGRVIGLTDWLLGRFGSRDRGGGVEGLALGCCSGRDVDRRGRP